VSRHAPALWISTAETDPSCTCTRHPDLATDQAPSGFHNYLDEFLSAIKVFGYLEKPVFHELARHLQTRRLVAGDTLNLDQDKSFYIVVDGSVQVFAKTSTPEKNLDAYDDEDDNGFQLLNNVESGGTLSSLFTILSLFTEDVKLRYEEEGKVSSRESQHLHHDVTDFELDGSQLPAKATLSPRGTTASDYARKHSFSSGQVRPLNASSLSSSATSSTLGSESPLDSPTTVSGPATEPNSPQTITDKSLHHAPLDYSTSAPTTPGLSDSPQTGLPSFDFGSGGGSAYKASYQSRMKRDGPTSSSQESREATIARAATDTTLAVIPAEAFRRLTKKFPNAAAHIVQGNVRG
jgi:lysophospholipid hydrolase